MDSGQCGRSGKEIDMVSRDSAQLFWPFEQRVAVDSDHTGMVKFPSREHETYRTLVRLINNRIESIGAYSTKIPLELCTYIRKYLILTELFTSLSHVSYSSDII